MSGVVILCGPYPVDDGLGGIGLRMWELAQLLADAGHQVTLVAPRTSDFTHPGVRITTGDARDQVKACDVVVTTDLPDTRLVLTAYRAGKLIVAENAPPIEHLHYDKLSGAAGEELYADTVARWRLQLLLADHLLVRSEAERASTFGALVAAGRMSTTHHRTDPALRHLVSLLPIGFNRHSARTAAAATAQQAGRCDVLWNGGVWDYCHPAPVLAALAAAAKTGSALSLRLLYEPAPVPRADLQHLAKELDVVGHLRWPTGPVPHRGRDAWVKAARALVVTGGRTAENMTCHRLRLRDAALYGLPVVVDSHGASGDLVAALGIGPAVDPADPDALARALLDAARDGPARRRYLTALAAARDRFTLERHIGPLLRLLDSGRPAPDRHALAHCRAIDTLLAEHPALDQRPPAVL
ncbi:hypothetical protein ACGFIV_32590 [Sphaerisporangium sp. NPDC049003]|uniref:hypothetical protein n=1 Tax=Sphaerisporangium sp. NPDC049003 TaxID=3364517 RepID=UPI00371BB7DD